MTTRTGSWPRCCITTTAAASTMWTTSTRSRRSATPSAGDGWCPCPCSGPTPPQIPAPCSPRGPWSWPCTRRRHASTARWSMSRPADPKRTTWCSSRTRHIRRATRRRSRWRSATSSAARKCGRSEGPLRRCALGAKRCNPVSGVRWCVKGCSRKTLPVATLYAAKHGRSEGDGFVWCQMCGTHRGASPEGTFCCDFVSLMISSGRERNFSSTSSLFWVYL
uniref:Uncharacterized protein n=1 Tax=Ixodes scapularis TaxID=6945 RepID=A0A4D5RVH8_IXOSC